MKALHDPDRLLGNGLVVIRAQFRIPASFPPAVLAAAEAAAQRSPDGHIDRTAIPFVTLDPASSTDLDQAFAIERSGADLLLRYAIADVGWFVGDGDALDGEAWARGETTYLPDGKAGLYPPILAEGAASLLPTGARPAVIFTTRIAPDGDVSLEGAERALIRSRAKLAYDSVRTADLPAGFEELARRIEAAEDRRGAARVDPPEQEVDEDDDGHFNLRFRPMLPSEAGNAALSLATNLAVADALLKAGAGLFRVMAGPDAGALARLRHTAHAFGLNWPVEASLEQFTRTLDPARPRDAAFMLAVRRAGAGASYVAYHAGVVPWHAAMAATYVHATAPLRRLADRYVIGAALAVANGKAVPAATSEAFDRLPTVMNKSAARAAQVERAVIDLAEAAMLAGREGEDFAAVVTDLTEHGVRFQLCELPVVARAHAHRVAPGTPIRVRLDRADPARREVSFSRIA